MGIHIWTSEEVSQHGYWKAGIFWLLAHATLQRFSTLLSIIFNAKGAVLQKPCKPREVMTRMLYRDTVLSQVKNFYTKAPPNTGMRGIKLLHNNTCSQVASHAREACKGEHWNFPTLCILTCPCSCAFFLFPHQKKCLSGKCFRSNISPWDSCFPVSVAYTQGDLLISISTMDWVAGEVCGSRCILWKGEVQNFPGGDCKA